MDTRTFDGGLCLDDSKPQVDRTEADLSLPISVAAEAPQHVRFWSGLTVEPNLALELDHRASRGIKQ